MSVTALVSLPSVSTSLETRQEYDVYLSYSREDYEFAEGVKKHLRQAGKTVYDFEMAAPLGSSVPVERSDMIMEHSRKTVIILSSAYVANKWCSFEASLAKVKSPGKGALQLGEPALLLVALACVGWGGGCVWLWWCTMHVKCAPILQICIVVPLPPPSPPQTATSGTSFPSCLGIALSPTSSETSTTWITGDTPNSMTKTDSTTIFGIGL